NSTLSGNSTIFGGGIANTGTLAIDNSEISGNTANIDGGGIHNTSGGIVTVSNSVISDNSASDDGGGIHNFVDSTVTVINSTIVGNSANDNGGGIYSRGSATVGNSTITGNTAGDDGGGIAVYTGATTISNSIVSGNTATDAGNELSSFGSGTVTVDGNNLLGSSESTFTEALNGFTPGVSDIVATSDNSSSATHDPTALANILEVDGQGDPLLQDNGGLTETVALVSGSPAINAGDNANISADVSDQDGDGDTAEDTPFDQRGTDFDRIGGSSVDIGAFERQNIAPTITSAATANAAENQTVAIDVDATDDSDTEGNGLTYSITDGDDAALFSID
ncbi:MAG: hypothetical protein F6K11_09305, partial [Leptolyngbya sp. SIO3F4]|nr:hypothetical protein [Leptolyngbya sp. SIO3F4]